MKGRKRPVCLSSVLAGGRDFDPRTGHVFFSLLPGTAGMLYLYLVHLTREGTEGV